MAVNMVVSSLIGDSLTRTGISRMSQSRSAPDRVFRWRSVWAVYSRTTRSRTAGDEWWAVLAGGCMTDNSYVYPMSVSQRPSSMNSVLYNPLYLP
jgi:hypothetical protein